MLPLADLRIAFDTDTLFDFGDGKSARACEVSAKVHKRKDIANATCKSIANAIETSAIVISMKTEALSIWRRDRLKSLSAKFGGNAPLGRALGYADGAFVGQMIKGLRPITEKTIQTAHELPGCSGWFSMNSDDSRAIFTLDKAIGSSNQLPLGESSASGQTSDHEIKRFDTGGAMGHGVVLKDQPGVIESWQVGQEWIQKNVKSFTSAKNLCVVTGFGDSMRGLFNPGDPLLVDIGVNTVDFEGVYFFRVENEGFVKRLQRIPGQGLLVISENTKYRDWTVTKDMDFQVFGRVVKVWCGEEL